MNGWTVREATGADAEALALIAGATFLQTYHAIIPVRDMIAHIVGKCGATTFAGWMADEGSAVLYAQATETGCPLGYAVLTSPDFPIETAPDDLELRRIYTLASTHGAGLGGALIAAALEEARAKGTSRVLLGVHPGNAPARRFYEKHGFRVIGERVFTVGNSRFEDPIYARAL